MELLDDMALFVEIVKAKGFRGAAEALHMPNSTISRHIRLLHLVYEARLAHASWRRTSTLAGCVA